MSIRACTFLLVLAAATNAGTLDVPGQYATIGAAVLAAHAGDTIVVQPGTYHEAVVLPALDLALLAPGGAAVTTIDAAGLGLSVLRADAPGSYAALVQGFTLTGGTGTPFPGFGVAGGGVHATSQLTLRACRITGNTAIAIAPESGSGGGVNGNARLEQCEVSDNVADSGGGIRGAPNMTDCVISGNTATFGGGVMFSDEPQGSWTRVTISGNSASYGGGCWASVQIKVVLSHASFLGNHASVEGGAVYLRSSPPFIFPIPNEVLDCILVGNTTDGGKATVASHVNFDTNVFLGSSTLVGEVLAQGASAAKCILWNMAAPLPAIFSVTSSDVEGGWPGPGNIDADPLFVNLAAGDLHLQPGSPCRNALAALPYSDTDVDGDPRKLEGLLDMGGDEFADDCNANGVLDWQELLAGTSADCEGDGLPDECQPFLDCNRNGLRDACDIASGRSPDCNGNGVPDECEALSDCNANGIADACESGDCNGNGVPDVCDLISGFSLDIDLNGVPDECHQIVRVPADQPTLAAAVAVCAPGDTVLVQPGVLTGAGNRGVVIAKSILVAGETNAEECILDCGGADRAFDITQGTVMLRDLTIRHGAANGGAGVLVENTAQLSVLRCRLLDNASGSLPGGALRARAGTQLDLRQSVLAGNRAGNGGALGIEAAAVVVDACSFSGNEATAGAGKGGAVRIVQGGSVTLRDCILFGDDASAGKELHAQDQGTLIDVAFCDVAGGAAGVSLTAGATLTWGAGNLAADPLFKDAAARDLRLSGGSPCIDSADPAGSPDADGTPPDMGALPFQPFEDLGHALAGGLGEPTLTGSGTATAGEGLSLHLSGALPFAHSALVLGATSLFAPFKGGVMVPDADLVIAPLVVRPDGTRDVSGRLPANLPSGTLAWVQWWIADAAGPTGFAASNGLSIEVR